MSSNAPMSPKKNANDSVQSVMSLAHRLLAKRKLGAFEVYFEKRSALKAESKDFRVDSVSQMQDAGLAVRVLNKKRVGFCTTTSLTPDAIERAVRTAIEISEVMPEDPDADFGSFKGAMPKDELGLLDLEGLRRPFDEKIKLAIELEKLTKARDARIRAVRSSAVSQSHVRRALMDAQGRLLEDESSSFSLSISCKSVDGDDQQFGGDFAFARKLSRLYLPEIAERAAENATELLHAKRPKSMECPAIIKNSLASELIEFLSASFMAEQIDKGLSLLVGKTGKPAFSKNITLADDGLLPEGAGTSRFDAEGVPCRAFNIVENGVFQTPLTNRKYAKKLGLKLTGSSARGLKTPPSISFGNLILKPGFRSAPEIRKNIERGVLLNELMGLHTANPVTGDFSLGASGFLIERGELTTPLKGFAVAGNILELFNQIEDISSDLRFFGNVATPSFRVGRLSIGGE